MATYIPQGADGATAPTNTVPVGGKDGSGNLQTLSTNTSGELQVGIAALPNEGQQTSANSISVTIASDQSNVPVVGKAPSSAGGWDTKNCTSSDGATALTNSAQSIKGSAGQLGGWFIYNPNTSAIYVHLYNVASGSVTVGTTNPQFMLVIPASSGANVLSSVGIDFTTAISTAATSTAGGNGAPTTAVEANFFFK